MRLLTLSLFLALLTTSVLLHQTQTAHVAAFASADTASLDTAKAQTILALARAAIGSEAKLKALQSLTITGSLRRTLGERQMEGEIQLDWLLPDKFMKTETLMPMPSIELTTMEVLNGADVWQDSQSGGGGGNVVIRRAAPDSPAGRTALTQNSRAELTRIWLGCLLNTSNAVPLEYSYAGEAEAADGKADVLEAKNNEGFAARLFLDQKSHRLLMLTYLARKPRAVMTQTMSGPPSEAELQKRIKEAEEQAKAQAPVEFQLRFSDYREESGLTFPHQVTKSVGDEVSEEWQLTKFKLNPQLKPEKFEKKK